MQRYRWLSQPWSRAVRRERVCTLWLRRYHVLNPGNLASTVGKQNVGYCWPEAVTGRDCEAISGPTLLAGWVWSVPPRPLLGMLGSQLVVLICRCSGNLRWWGLARRSRSPVTCLWSLRQVPSPFLPLCYEGEQFLCRILLRFYSSSVGGRAAMGRASWNCRTKQALCLYAIYSECFVIAKREWVCSEFLV